MEETLLLVYGPKGIGFRVSGLRGRLVSSVLGNDDGLDWIRLSRDFFHSLPWCCVLTIRSF